MNRKLKNIDTAHEDFIFRSDFYEIKFLNNDDSMNAVEGWNENFCVTYIHSGNFLFDLFRHNYNLHTGCILLDKPRCDFKIQPTIGQCTIIRFYSQFYETILQNANAKNLFYLSNENLLSLSLKSSPALDYLHYQIFETRYTTQQLEMDVLVVEFLNRVIAIIHNDPSQINYVNNAVKKYHFPMVEQAKEYMCRHITEDISLNQIATHACISPFHFSRVFKQFTSFSPNQYLLNMRLANSERLLKYTALPIGEVAHLSGFKTSEYFSTYFKQKFDKNPSEYRRTLHLL
jgi:AraC-like DNA-binding protein